MKLLIYMPAYNEEAGIGETIKELPKKLDGVDKISILVVDDHSKDKTAEIARSLGATVISHKENKMVGGAFHTALKYALDNDFDAMITTDADRQFNLKQIPDVLRPVLEGKADMVMGNRFTKGVPKNMPVTKYWGNKQMAWLISKLTGKKFRDVSCGFRAYSKDALQNFNLYGKKTYTQETILDLIYKDLTVIEYPVDVIYYKGRVSRVAASIIDYAVKTSKIIFETVRIYKPSLFFGLISALLIILGLLISLLDIYVFTNTNLSLITFGLLITAGTTLIAGQLAAILHRIKMNQERILIQLKKTRHENQG